MVDFIDREGGLYTPSFWVESSVEFVENRKKFTGITVTDDREEIKKGNNAIDNKTHRPIIE
ncbi:MAG: hypothetical protein IJU61_05530 [Victivallales bacterium]|nr:hypothetical protein [Victivallales bacterium]